MHRSPVPGSRRPLAVVLSLLVALLASAGCEIVQSNIPITLEDDSAAEVDAGGGDFPPYPGTACGQASAVLCTLSMSAPDAALADSGLDASEDAPLDAPAPTDAAQDVEESGVADSAPDGAASADGWCALRCFKHCDTKQWECTGTVCGVGEPPPSCEPLQ